MSKKKEFIAIISEGEKTEKQIINNLENNFTTFSNKIIFLSYKANIYNLFREIEEDEDIDIISLLKEKQIKANKIRNDVENIDVSNINSDDISQIYLFFDYDGHNNKTQDYTDDVLKKMLEFFYDETDNGKLYISYPMIESICYTKKLPDNNYVDYVISLDKSKEFKNTASEFSDYKNFDLISFKLNKYGQGVYVDIDKYPAIKQNWQHIIKQNIIKANFICNDKKTMPINTDDITQQKIFISQKQKYIQNNELAILASYPLFLYEYFGISKIFVSVNCKKYCPFFFEKKGFI